MSFLLRAINRRRWDKLPWLGEGKCQADALLDLKPLENKLSFWHVEGDESNLNGVIAAVAAGTDYPPDKFDYALFDQSLLEETGVRIERTPGDSFHKEADKNWHRDTTDLSADNVVEIVNIITRHGGIRKRIQKREITQILKEEVDSGSIDIAALKEKSEQKKREIARIHKEEVDSGLIDIASPEEESKQKWSSHWLEQIPSQQHGFVS